MINKIRNWQIAGAIFTVIAGTCVHFIHEWFGGTVTAVIGAVNESTWEHLKLIFWPVFLFGIVEYIVYGKKIKGFLTAKVLSILVGMISIVALFYTYAGILGKNYLGIDIAVFILGTIAAYLFSYKHLYRIGTRYLSSGAALLSAILLALLLVCFIVFTYDPPKIGLFLDPVSGFYGI